MPRHMPTPFAQNGTRHVYDLSWRGSLPQPHLEGQDLDMLSLAKFSVHLVPICDIRSRGLHTIRPSNDHG